MRHIRFYINIGLMEAGTFWSEFSITSSTSEVWHNLIPVTIGNFIGGGILLGVVQWITYEDGSWQRAGHHAARRGGEAGLLLPLAGGGGAKGGTIN